MTTPPVKDELVRWAEARLDVLRIERPSRWMYLARAEQLRQRGQLDDAVLLALAAERMEVRQ